ncbi:Rab32/38 family gtpase [Globisporangium polare]
MRKFDATSTLFPASNAAASAAAAATGTDRSRQMLEHRNSDLARAMAEQRENASAGHDGGSEQRRDDGAEGGGGTLEEVDEDDSAGSLSGGEYEDSDGEGDDEEDGDNIDEKEPLPMNMYNDEDYSKMDIEEVRLRLAELENTSGPTKEEIDAMLAQYSDYSDGSGGGSSDDASDSSSEGGSTRQETVIMKVLIVGNARCGKTSTIRQFVSKEFSENYVSTIGADFVEKLIEYDEQLKISLQLWDIAGQDRFAKLTRAYFREAKGALIVCDITRENTIDAVETWKNEIDTCARDLNGGECIPVVMVANKSDLLEDIVGALNIGVNMQKCVARNGIVEWFRASAKSGDSVDEAFQCLIDRMVVEHRAAIEKKNAALLLAAEKGGDGAVGKELIEDNSAAGQRRRDDDIIRLTSFPPLGYENTGGLGCECN